ncbi:MAG: hypothetical protein JXA33_19545 [Anaerolineae bacterium]|nr:hypothetical protein [Anaerolineae bacterium]
MEHPESTLNEVWLRKTLIIVLNHIMPACNQIAYRLVGTGAALLHGVELPSTDIDILVKRREDVDAIGAALSWFKCLVTPVWLPDARQYYGSYEVNGVEVEISTVEIETEVDTIETFGRGPWEHFTPIPCGPYAVPTVALELRLITELFRNRPERYEPIICYMQAKGCDIDLIHRGMDTAGLPQAAQEKVLEQLKEKTIN